MIWDERMLRIWEGLVWWEFFLFVGFFCWFRGWYICGLGIVLRVGGGLYCYSVIDLVGSGFFGVFVSSFDIDVRDIGVGGVWLLVCEKWL